MASHSILADEHIMELLGDDTNSELSYLSDEEVEYFQSREFNCLMTNFDDCDFNLLLDEDDVNPFSPDNENEIVLSIQCRLLHYCRQ